MAAPAAGEPLDRLPQPVAIALEQAGVPQEAVGAYVLNASSGEAELAFGENRGMNPASVIKLLTAFAALELLGPAYRLKTEAYLDGELIDGRLHGNLVVKGYGDPRFTLERFWLFLRDLRHRGLREIDGDLVLDRTHFAVDAHDAAAFDNEPLRPYNAGPDALLLNFSSFRLQFVPDENARTVRIYSEPSLPQVEIVNRLALGFRHCDHWPDTPAQHRNTLIFEGVFPEGCGEKLRHFSLLSANEYFGTVFRQLWGELGGRFSGEVLDGQAPAGAAPFAAAESAPVADLVRDINKHSSNVMARQLYLTLGIAEGPPLSLDKAGRSLRSWLAGRGLDMRELQIDNGSGLSRTARTSAREMGELLLAAWHSPLMPVLVSSLPMVAVDGTMRRRLGGSAVAGQAYVKTGYLDGVRTMAGYLQDSRGRMMILVFFVNHPWARHTEAAHDALLEWVHTGIPQGCCRRMP
ncbi:MAG: D-alanyl-D-alanine carboxypeptidase/D-alanyl-D-alanine-endopeptidase [Burkholderiales bacterium]